MYKKVMVYKNYAKVLRNDNTYFTISLKSINKFKYLPIEYID